MIRTETLLGLFPTKEEAEDYLKSLGYIDYPDDEHETHYRHPDTTLLGWADGKRVTPYWTRWLLIRERRDGQFAVVNVNNVHWKDFEAR